MPYRLHPNQRLDAELRRVAREQVDRALSELADLRPREAAHQVRKRCKKVRALLRIVRPELGKRYKPENIRFRDIARRLAPLRDSASLVEAVEALEDSAGESFEAIKQTLCERRDEIERKHECILPEVRHDLQQARAAIDDWRLPAEGLPQGVKRPYQRGRRKSRKSKKSATPHRLHQWRKRAKYHRYHCRLLESAWPRPLETREQEAHDLTDLLGESHDLSELTQLLQKSPSRFGGPEAVDALLRCAEQRQADLRKQSLQLGAKLFAEKPKALIKRLETYWQAA